MPGESQRAERQERQVLELVLSHLKSFRYINEDEARRLKAWCKGLIATSEALTNMDGSMVTEVKPGSSTAGTLRKDWQFPRDGISYTIRNHSKSKTYYISVSIQEVRPDEE